ncbi:MAG: DUF4288 domain-containing protein [Sporomusaceae bacterium]|jgi:hypothetical protein|nr:DUF4288 domain-containing protein [Sporomusaceae bacterium]
MKKKSAWEFYGVKIIKQIIVSGEPEPNLLDEFYENNAKQTFEESILLIRAQSFDQAYKIAAKKAREGEQPYQNKYGQQVIWKFIEAVDCFAILDELVSGAEIYSCFHTANEGELVEDFLDKWFHCIDDGCRKARYQ